MVFPTIIFLSLEVILLFGESCLILLKKVESSLGQEVSL